MAKSNKTQQLSIEQENAIDLLIQGKGDREVAEAVHVSRQTVNQWQNHDAVFVAALNARRQETWGSQSERLRNLVAKAIDVLEEDLSSDEKKLRQSAAIHILKSVKLYGRDLQPYGETAPEGIEREWDREAFFKRL